jgi:hypothetical protein
MSNARLAAALALAGLISSAPLHGANAAPLTPLSAAAMPDKPTRALQGDAIEVRWRAGGGFGIGAGLLAGALIGSAIAGPAHGYSPYYGYGYPYARPYSYGYYPAYAAAPYYGYRVRPRPVYRSYAFYGPRPLGYGYGYHGPAPWRYGYGYGYGW